MNCGLIQGMTTASACMCTLPITPKRIKRLRKQRFLISWNKFTLTLLEASYFGFQAMAGWYRGWSPSFYSPLVQKKPGKHYSLFGSDLRAESVKLHWYCTLHKPTIIFAISPAFCVLYVYPFKVCVTDRWQQPGWEMGWGFVHGIMQHHISANSRVLWLSKTSRCISLEVLWKIQLSHLPPSLSLCPSLSLFLSDSYIIHHHLFSRDSVALFATYAVLCIEWTANLPSLGTWFVISVH